jgi:hypothetical protein
VLHGACSPQLLCQPYVLHEQALAQAVLQRTRCRRSGRGRDDKRG